MAGRIFISATVEEVAELASELERVSKIAKSCSEYMKNKGGDPYQTDGFNSAVEGIDAIIRLLGGVVGVYNAPPAKLETIREKLNGVRAAKKAAQGAKDIHASKTVRQSDSKPSLIPAKSATKPTPQPTKTSRKKKV